MTTATTSTIEPASPPALGAPQASIEVAREIASECTATMVVQCRIIDDALSIGADAQARFAFRQLRLVGRALSAAMDALGPQAGPDGAVVQVKGKLQ